MRSYWLKISSTLSLSSRVSCRRTSTWGLISSMESRALSALDRPTSDLPWMIWRCRFDSSTTSNSTMPSVPTPAAARYMSTGEPRPPAPTASTLAFFSRFCPSIPTSGMIRWRLYRRTSSIVRSAAGSTRGGRDTSCSSVLDSGPAQAGVRRVNSLARPPDSPSGSRPASGARLSRGTARGRGAVRRTAVSGMGPGVLRAALEPEGLLLHDGGELAGTGARLVAVAEGVADLVVHDVVPVGGDVALVVRDGGRPAGQVDDGAVAVPAGGVAAGAHAGAVALHAAGADKGHLEREVPGRGLGLAHPL